MNFLGTEPREREAHSDCDSEDTRQHDHHGCRRRARSHRLLAQRPRGVRPGGAGAGRPRGEPEGLVLHRSAFGYLLPDEPDYAQPTLSADRGRLHLETRYNYEGLHAGSAWAGCNFTFGRDVEFTLTPMLGAVFGDTSGVAPGYKASALWRKLDFISESEFVFDTGESSDSFFYTWSELGWSPRDWLRLGLVVQRTKVYQTGFDIQRGFLLGVAYRKASFTAYVFNPDASRPVVVLGASVEF